MKTGGCCSVLDFKYTKHLYDNPNVSSSLNVLWVKYILLQIKESLFYFLPLSRHNQTLLAHSILPLYMYLLIYLFIYLLLYLFNVQWLPLLPVPCWVLSGPPRFSLEGNQCDDKWIHLHRTNLCVVLSQSSHIMLQRGRDHVCALLPYHEIPTRRPPSFKQWPFHPLQSNTRASETPKGNWMIP